MGDLTPVLGIICGMKAEAQALGAWAHDARVRVAISGARPECAEAEARRLVAEGCRGLLSWGLAGGLDPELAPGDAVTAGSVLCEDGTALPATPVPGAARVSRCLGTERIILTPIEKADLHRRLGADFVDMESHRAALVAANASLPFFVLRAIADPADRVLPPWVVGALAPDGAPRLGAVLAGVARRPFRLRALWQLKGDSDAGLRGLKATAETDLPAILTALSPSSSRA